jgi:two-component system cell cycle sensor histidine kinase/response regulator CckA
MVPGGDSWQTRNSSGTNMYRSDLCPLTYWGAMAVVLIVEDEEPLRVLPESIIQDRGHTTLSASTLEQAIALLEGDQTVELLFTDLGLHDDMQAGLKAAQEAVKRVPNLPVLYTTGQGITDGMRAMFVERNGFIAKPYTADQLSTAIDNLLR